MTDENIDNLPPLNETESAANSDSGINTESEQKEAVERSIADVTNASVTIKYPIPTPGVEVSEKGKHIEPISLPNSTCIEILNDDYWENIARIHSAYGLDFIESNSEDMRIVKAKVKKLFESTFGKTFTEDEYLRIHQINNAVSILFKINNLSTDKRDPFEREGAKFEQGILDTKGNLKPLGGAAQLAENDLHSTPLTGPRAAVELGMRLGFGTNGNFFLPNSGISVVFNNPSNSELFNLDEEIDAEKVDLGMATMGYFFGANGQRYYNNIVNFILGKIVKKTPNFTTMAELRRFIKVTDIQALAIGLSNVMYPDGYPFATYDSYSKAEIQHGLIKPLRCMLVDNNAIPEGCKRILEKRVITPEDLADYQQELEASFKNQWLVIGEDTLPILIKFKIPNLEEYEAQSNIWIKFIESVVTENRAQLSPQERANIFATHANTAVASQYLPYVDYVYYLDSEEANSEAYLEGRYSEIVAASDGKRKISKPEDILPSLNLISADSRLTEQFVEAVALYRDSSNVYAIGVPEVLTDEQIKRMELTPEEVDYYRKHPKMIPIDAVSLFFLLRGRRFNNWSIVPVKRTKN